ncbi:MAG: dipeptidase, partial [Phycisphaeraceae bacterium]
KFPPLLPLDHAQQQTDAMIDLLDRIVVDSNGRVAKITDAEALETSLNGDDTFAAVLHFEGAEAIDPALEALPHYYERGLRSLGLTWSRPNAFAHGAPFWCPGSSDVGPGLTEPGRALVKACNELGILLDLSHLNAAGFRDVAKLSDAPLVATHSNAHALCPAARNLTDDQLDAIAATDGIVGINYAVIFLREDGRNDADTPLDRIADHLSYIADRIGIDHVGLGSDFDGAKVPAALADAAGLPRLIAVLRQRGFTEADLEKITRTNWLRVLRQTWQ